MIEGLSLDSMRIAMLNAFYQQPSFILRILEANNHPSNLHESPIQPSPQDILSWCRCTNCREMPSELENRCFNGIVTQDYLLVTAFVLQNLYLSLQSIVSSISVISLFTCIYLDILMTIFNIFQQLIQFLFNL